MVVPNALILVGLRVRERRAAFSCSASFISRDGALAAFDTRVGDGRLDVQEFARLVSGCTAAVKIA